MHEYWALTFLCENIEEKQDYRIDWLKKNVKEIVIDIGEEKSNDEFSVETVIDPIINVFSSYGKTPVKCLAINYGYRCWTSERLSNSRNRILLDYIGNIQSRINLEIFKFILEIINLKEAKEPINIFYGMCDDHSYVQEYESENIIKLGAKPHDKYIWFDSNGKVEDSEGVSYSEVIYRLFPKKYITLPSKESSLIVNYNLELIQKLKEILTERIPTVIDNNNNINEGLSGCEKMFGIEGFPLDYFEEDYSSEFRDAMRNWNIPSNENIDNIKKYENMIKNRLVFLNKVSAVYIECIRERHFYLCCNVGGFEIGKPIDPHIDKIIFAEVVGFGEFKDYTSLEWWEASGFGGFRTQLLRRTNGRPLELKEKFNNVKNRKMC